MEQITAKKTIPKPPADVMEIKIGNTVFMVSSHFDKSSRESAAAKMGRVLKRKSKEDMSYL